MSEVKQQIGASKIASNVTLDAEAERVEQVVNGSNVAGSVTVVARPGAAVGISYGKLNATAFGKGSIALALIAIFACIAYVMTNR